MDELMENIKHWQSSLAGIALGATAAAKLLGYDLVITQEQLVPAGAIVAGVMMIFGIGKKK